MACFARVIVEGCVSSLARREARETSCDTRFAFPLEPRL